MNKYRFSWRTVVILGAVVFGVSAFAQPPRKVDNNVSSDTDKRPFDKHDFSGLWARNPQAYKMDPCPECRDAALAPGYGFFGDVPPRTAEGEKRMKANKPGRGYELGSKDAADIFAELAAGHTDKLLKLGISPKKLLRLVDIPTANEGVPIGNGLPGKHPTVELFADGMDYLNAVVKDLHDIAV